MKKLFDDLSLLVSKKTTEKYSSSFSVAILSLDINIRSAIYAIYGFVRLADEIVDSFQDYDREKLLAGFRQQTQEALNERISINPILNSFQEVVYKYKIDILLINHFLDSMEMDLRPLTYNDDLYKKYIFGSAEVVGLMCLQVFVEGNEPEFDRLKPYARLLGSAFQKVNFLRDLKADYQILGRNYFPTVDFNSFDDHKKQQIEREIEEEFREALKGIEKLPASSRFGVLLAYNYYQSLFGKIKRIPANQIMRRRVRLANLKKIFLIITSYFQCKLTLN